jgi:uncharacterized membrane protein
MERTEGARRRAPSWGPPAWSLGHVVWFGLWIGANVAMKSRLAFAPYPFPS